MNFDKYINTEEYPTKYYKFKCSCGYRVESKHIYCGNCGTNIQNTREDEKNLYNRALKEYKDNEKRLLEQFKQDALADAGLLDHKNKDKIYEFAWSHGHSAGLQEVYYWLEEITELFEE